MFPAVTHIAAIRRNLRRNGVNRNTHARSRAHTRRVHFGGPLTVLQYGGKPTPETTIASQSLSHSQTAQQYRDDCQTHNCTPSWNVSNAAARCAINKRWYITTILRSGVDLMTSCVDAVKRCVLIIMQTCDSNRGFAHYVFVFASPAAIGGMHHLCAPPEERDLWP